MYLHSHPHTPHSSNLLCCWRNVDQMAYIPLAVSDGGSHPSPSSNILKRSVHTLTLQNVDMLKEQLAHSCTFCLNTHDYNCPKYSRFTLNIWHLSASCLFCFLMILDEWMNGWMDVNTTVIKVHHKVPRSLKMTKICFLCAAVNPFVRRVISFWVSKFRITLHLPHMCIYWWGIFQLTWPINAVPDSGVNSRYWSV